MDLSAFACIVPHLYFPKKNSYNFKLTIVSELCWFILEPMVLFQTRLWRESPLNILRVSMQCVFVTIRKREIDIRKLLSDWTKQIIKLTFASPEKHCCMRFCLEVRLGNLITIKCRNFYRSTKHRGGPHCYASF